MAVQSVAAVLAVTALCLVQGVSSQLACFSDRSCSNQIGTHSEEQCCHSLNGGSVNTGRDDEGYSECKVYGWKGELEVEVKVLGNVTLTIGYINGVPDRGRQFNLLYDVKTFSVVPSSVDLGLRDEIMTIKVIRDDVIPLQRFNITLVEVLLNQQRGNILLATLQIVIAGQKDARVGLEKISYIVMNESMGEVEICAHVFEPVIRCPIEFASNLSFDTIDGSAASTKDYIGVSTVLMFERCAIRQCVNLSIVDDTVPEETEYFTVKIGRSLNLHPNINLRPTEANITISDDDPIVVGYEPTVYTTTEGQGSVVLVAVVLFPKTGAPRPFTIAASTSNGTADGGSDYISVMIQQLVFNIGDTRQSHTITISDDTICEKTPNEHFFSDLFPVSGLITINPMRATVVINDFNESECGITIGFVRVPSIVSESVGMAVVTIGLTSGVLSGESVTVQIFTMDGSATNNADYSETVRNITFMGGQVRNVDISIPIINDVIAENNENFKVGLFLISPFPYVYIDMQRTIQITDDDTISPGTTSTTSLTTIGVTSSFTPIATSPFFSTSPSSSFFTSSSHLPTSSSFSTSSSTSSLSSSSYPSAPLSSSPFVSSPLSSSPLPFASPTSSPFSPPLPPPPTLSSSPSPSLLTPSPLLPFPPSFSSPSLPPPHTPSSSPSPLLPFPPSSPSPYSPFPQPIPFSSPSPTPLPPPTPSSSLLLPSPSPSPSSPFPLSPSPTLPLPSLPFPFSSPSSSLSPSPSSPSSSLSSSSYSSPSSSHSPSSPSSPSSSPPSSVLSTTLLSVIVALVIFAIAITIVTIIIIVMAIVRRRRRTRTYYTAGAKFNHYIEVEVKQESAIRETTPDYLETSFLKGVTVTNGNKGDDNHESPLPVVVGLPEEYGTSSFKGELSRVVRARSKGSHLEETGAEPVAEATREE